MSKCISLTSEQKDNIKQVVKVNVLSRLKSELNTRGSNDTESKKLTYSDIGKRVIQEIFIDLKKDTYKLESTQEVTIFKDTIEEALNSKYVTSLFEGLPEYALEYTRLGANNGISELLNDYVKKGETPTRDKLGLYNDPTIKLNDRVRQKMKGFNEAYSKSDLIHTYFLDKFKEQLMVNTIVDFEKGIIVKNDHQLNKNIANIKDNLYKDLVEFTKQMQSKKGIMPLSYRRSLYKDGKFLNERLSLILNDSYEFIKDIPINKLESQFLSNRFSSNLADNSILNAHLAFTLLSGNNFDNVMSSVIGDAYVINSNYGRHSNSTALKYSLFGKSNITTSWRVDDYANAVSELGNIPKLLIESTPIRNFRIRGVNKQLSNERLEINQFVNTFNKLRNPIIRRKADFKLKNLDLRSNPTEYIREILSNVMEWKNVQFGFTMTDLNILKSIYERFYNASNPNSLYSIVIKDQATNNQSTSYNLLNAISGIIDRTQESNYLQYIVNRDGSIDNTRLRTASLNTRKRYYENRIQEHAKRIGGIGNKQNIIDKYNIKEVRPNSTIANMQWTIEYPTTESPNNVMELRYLDLQGRRYGLEIKVDGEWKVFNTVVKTISTEKITDAVLNNNLNSLLDSDGRYLALIKFISEMTGLDFLSQTNIREFAILDGLTNYHFVNQHLAKLTNSIIHKMYIYNKYDNFVRDNPNDPRSSSIKEYAKSEINYYKNRLDSKNEKESAMFEPQDNSLKVTEPIDYATIDALAEAYEIANNNTYKSTLKNADGNMISSNRIAHFNGLFERILRTKAQSPDSSQSNNLFSTNEHIFLGNVIKADLKGAGISKQVSDFTTSELIYTSMIQDFYGGMFEGVNEKSATALHKDISSKAYSLIQPIVFSDKKYYVNLMLDTDANILITDPFNGEYISFSLKDATVDNLKSAIAATIGEGYHDLSRNIRIDYNEIFKYNDNSLLVKALENVKAEVESLQTELTDSSITLSDQEIDYLGETYNELNVPEQFKDLIFNNISKYLAKKVNGKILINPEFKKDSLKLAQKVAKDYLNEKTNQSKELNNILGEYDEKIKQWNATKDKVNKELDTLYKWQEDFLSKDDSYKVKNQYDYADNLNKIKKLESELALEPKNPLDDISLSQYDLLLQNINKSEFIETADKAGVGLVTDLHYVTKGGKLRASNSLIYNTEKLYEGNKREMNKYFANEEVKFVRDLFDNNIKLDLRDKEFRINSILRKAVDYVLADSKDEWVDTNVERLILAKNAKTGEVIKDSSQLEGQNPRDILINPLLRKYFYSSYLVSKNYRTLMVGSELAYPTHNSEYKPTLENIEIELSEQDTAQSKRSSSNIAPIHNVTMNDRNGPASKMRIAVIDDVAAEAWNFSGDKESGLDSSDGSALVAGPIHWLENYALQDKRTGKDKKMHAFDINDKYHTGQFLKFATFLISNDRMAESMGSEAPLYNLWKKMSDFKWSEATKEGRFGKANSAGDITPFHIDLTKDIFGGNLDINSTFNEIDLHKSTMNKIIIENVTELKGDMVNADIHIFDDNNQLIRSWNDNIDKTTANMYNGYYREVKVLDLIKADRIDLSKYESEESRNAEQLKIDQALDNYNENNIILDGEYEKLYLLRVDAVQSDGSRIGDGTGYYEVHKIDSLFDLYNALGGVNSFRLLNNEFIRSDASLEALSFFMNNVGEYHGQLKEQIDSEGKVVMLPEAAEIIDQTNTYQPLKTGDAIISYVVNKSAMKTGSINVNDSKAYTDPNIKLKTMEYGIDALGIQSDTETSIDDVNNITEFSQVIQALIAKGYMTEDVEDIYTALANIAKSEVPTLIEATQKLNDNDPNVQAKAKTELAKLTIRNLISSIGEGDSSFGTQKATIELLKKGLIEMAKGKKDFTDLSFLMPISDPSLYKKATTDFTAFVNKTAIKRKFTGKGLTLTPSYNMIQMYYHPQDSIKIASNKNNPEILHKFSDIQKNARNTDIQTIKMTMDIYGYQKRFPNFYARLNTIIENNGSDASVLRSRGSSVDEYMKFMQIKTIFETESDMKKANRGNIDMLSPESRILIPSDDVANLINTGKLEADWVAKNTTQGQDILSGYHEIYINTFDKYIKVKDTFSRFIPDVTKPINLRPSRIQWKDSKGYNWNAFDLKTIRDSFKFKSLMKDLVKDLDRIENFKDLDIKVIDKLVFQRVNQFVKSLEGSDYLKDTLEVVKQFKGSYDISSFITKLGIINTKVSESVFNDLHKGRFKMNPELARQRGIELNEEGYAAIPKETFRNEAAEVILPNIFKHLFGVDQNVSISQVLSSQDTFFSSKFLDDITINDNIAYDLAFVTPNKTNNLYIVFDKNQIDTSYHKIEHKVTETEVVDGVEYLIDNRNKRSIKLNKIDGEGNIVEELVSMYESSTGDITYVAHTQEGLQSIVDNMDKYDSFKFNTSRAHIVKDKIKGLNTKNKFIEILNNEVFNNKIDLENLITEEDSPEEIQFKENNEYTKIADNYIRTNIANKFGMQKFVSFNEALNFISSRIPAQTMQSFMKMRAAAFTNESEGSVYVSHWQTWLQGSDFDIDTAWLMGVEIGKNGLYQGWSPYFSLNSVAHLEVSKTLNAPTGVELNLVTDNPNATDITGNILKYEAVKAKYGSKLYEDINFIKILSEVLKDTKNSTALTYDTDAIKNPEIANELVDIINTHNLYTVNESKYNMHGKLNTNDKGLAFRNIANSKMMKVIQDPRNMVQSHMPVEMDAPKRAAAKSSLGVRSMKDNFNNPAAMSELQSQNGDGKNGISISAVGLKVFFTLSYYYNKVLKSGDPTKIKNLAMFKSYPALANTMDGTGIRLALANVNWSEVLDSSNIDFWKSIIERKISRNGISEYESTLAIKNQLKVGQDQALIMSALLSAATDNAKELILSKLSAGPETMGIYLYLSMMGYEFDKISDFMTSNTIQSIIKLSKNNSFENGLKNNSINMTVKNLENGPNINDFFNDFQIKNLLGSYLATSENNASVGSIIYTLRDEYQNPLGDVKALFKNLKASHKDMVAVNRYIEEFENLKRHKNKFDDKIFDTFKEIIKDSSSIVVLGQMLGMNQGIKTSVSERLAVVGSFENHFAQTVNRDIGKFVAHEGLLLHLKKNKNFISPYKSDTDGSVYLSELVDRVLKHNLQKEFDFFKFTDPDNSEYARTAIDLYDIYKPSFNIYDVLYNAEHFKEMYRINWAMHKKSYNESFKYRMTYDIFKLISSEESSNPFSRQLNDNQISKIESYVDDLMIYDWLKEQSHIFTLSKGEMILDKDFNKVPVENDMRFDLSNRDGESEFIEFIKDKGIPERWANSKLGIELNINTKEGLSKFIENTKIGNIPDELLINDQFTFLMSKNDNQRYITENFTEKPVQQDMRFTLNNVNGIQNFKKWVEDHVVPELKQGIVDSDNVSSTIMSNSFIKDIDVHKGVNGDSGGPMTFLRLPIEMTSFRTKHDMTLFQSYQQDFKKLSKYTKGGMRLDNLFFLYNLLVNKNKYGADRLTSIFSDYEYDTDSIAYKYHKSLGEADTFKQTPNLSEHIDRIYIKIAEMPRNSMDMNKSAYLTYDKRLGRTIVVSNKIDTTLLNGINLNDSQLAIKYNHGVMPLVSEVFSPTDITMLSGVGDISTTLNHLIKMNKITIKYDC